MNFKVFGLLGALLLAPVAVVAAPANGLTAHSYVDMTTAPQAASGAAVAPGDSAKVEKVWWRRGGWGWGGYGWRGGYGFRRGWGGYYGYRPLWRRRFFVY